MNFLLSDDQLAFLDTVRGLLKDRCDPQRVHAVFDGEEGFDRALWGQLCEMGVPAIMVPEAHGGLGLEMIDLAIVAELLGEFAAPTPFFGHVLAALAISLAGSEAQKTRWLPGLASGAALGAVAFGEGDDHWLADEWRMEPGSTLAGTKVLVPNAAEADLIVVGVRGGLAVVEKGASFTCTRLDSVDRTRRVDTVEFQGAAAEALDGAAQAVDRVVDAAAVLLAADAFGGARHLAEMSVEYAKVRVQYGQTIGSFQGLKHQLSNMALAVEPTRGLYWFAAHAWDAMPDKARYAAAQAKAHCTDVYLQASRDTVEAHGGIGFTWEHDTHLYFKRAMFDWAWLGQPNRHRLRATALAGW